MDRCVASRRIGRIAIILLAVSSVCLPGRLVRAELLLERQVTGIQTNCYLLFDAASGEAALFDVGGSIDSLLSTIAARDLELRYFFFTHGHPDHTLGLPAVRDSFPDARVVMHERAFEDMQVFIQWAREDWGEEEVEAWAKADPEHRRFADFDASEWGEPDILVKDGQRFPLGGHELRAIHTPGHSTGSICYHVDGLLFTGDLLFRRRVGRVDLRHGSREAMIRSVRRLYAELPDSTRVYPGHGGSTRIGTEEVENEEVTTTSTDL